MFASSEGNLRLLLCKRGRTWTTTALRRVDEINTRGGGPFPGQPGEGADSSYATRDVPAFVTEIATGMQGP